MLPGDGSDGTEIEIDEFLIDRGGFDRRTEAREDSWMGVDGGGSWRRMRMRGWWSPADDDGEFSNEEIMLGEFEFGVGSNAAERIDGRWVSRELRDLRMEEVV